MVRHTFQAASASDRRYFWLDWPREGTDGEEANADKGAGEEEAGTGPATTNSETIDAKIDLSPRFKLVFNTVAILTAACLVIPFVLAWRETTNPTVDKVVTSCLAMAATGVGAMCGLIGGKNL